ncbi:MAG: carbohydrate binding family 9 domain-containing protein [Candidatus Cloacimonetes bacterium]|nr:carbohydrate binding family 9 domain-containing protein [Candidatus Cloacimonadota bacterium]
MKKFNIFLFLMVFQLSLLSAKIELQIPRLTSPPLVDGYIAEGEWEEALRWDEFWQTSPGDNSEPSEPTIFYIGYDDKNLYAAFVCTYSDPGIVRAFHGSRDRIFTSDRVFIFLDTFLSNHQAYYFGANMHGEQADGIVLQEIDTSHDFYYESRGALTADGYRVEFAIPFRSLKYRSGRNVSWGAFIRRIIPERNEEITAFQVRREAGNYFDNYAIFKFAELPPNLNLRLNPAATLASEIREDRLADTEEVENRVEPELNIFFEPNSSVTATATINPDFNIIEADALAIEVNSRHPVYYTEKRPFFLESSNPFQTDINIFHTRRIVDPLWGLKISSLMGRYSSFALVSLDEDVPADRFSVEAEGEGDALYSFLNFTRRLGSGNQHLRLAGTLRRYREAESFVVNYDHKLTWRENLNIFTQLLYSLDQVPLADGIREEKGYGYYLEGEFNNSTWYLSNSLKGISRGFQADLGYIPETDINKLASKYQYQIHAATDEDMIRYAEIKTEQHLTYDFDWRERKELYWQGSGGMLLQNKLEFWTGFELIRYLYEGRTYQSHYPWLCLEYYPWRQLGAKVVLVDGKNLYYGPEQGYIGNYVKFETSLFLRPFSSLDIELQQKYHETEKFYIARTYEVIAKFQVHRNFWLRLITQITDIDEWYCGESYQRISFYPLFVFKPSANASVYLGASRSSRQSETWREMVLDSGETLYFLKLSYNVDVFN